eukprot:1161257-Pelagomonas_calceolata.AAC.9
MGLMIPLAQGKAVCSARKWRESSGHFFWENGVLDQKPRYDALRCASLGAGKMQVFGAAVEHLCEPEVGGARGNVLSVLKTKDDVYAPSMVVLVIVVLMLPRGPDHKRSMLRTLKHAWCAQGAQGGT